MLQKDVMTLMGLGTSQLKASLCRAALKVQLLTRPLGMRLQPVQWAHLYCVCVTGSLCSRVACLGVWHSEHVWGE